MTGRWHDPRYWVAVRVFRYDEESECGIMRPIFWGTDRDSVEREVKRAKEILPGLMLYPISWKNLPDPHDEYEGERQVPREREEEYPELKEAVEEARMSSEADRELFPDLSVLWKTPSSGPEESPPATVTSIEEYRQKHGIEYADYEPGEWERKRADVRSMEDYRRRRGPKPSL